MCGNHYIKLSFDLCNLESFVQANLSDRRRLSIGHSAIIGPTSDQRIVSAERGGQKTG